MKTYRLIVALVLIVMLALPATVAGAQGPRFALVSLTAPIPTPAPAQVGSEIAFDLLVSVTDVSPGVSGADIYLKYDPTVVTPPSPNSVAEAKADFFGASNVSINEVVQCPGSTSSCIHLVVAGPAQVTHSGAVARFHFKVISGGTACFSIFQSTLADADGIQVEHSKGPDQCLPTSVIVPANGLVYRQGLVTPNLGGGTKACSSVTATSSAGTTTPVFTDVDGKFVVKQLSSGTYTFRASYPGYLDSVKTGVTVSATTTTIDLGATTLRGGDVNADTFINILDIGLIISRFGQKASDAGGVRSATPANCGATDNATDINDDGVVNISDLAIAAGNWPLKTGPTLWQ